MRSVWHSLLWKEWRENRWKLAALTVAILTPLIIFVGRMHGSPVSFLVEFTFAVLTCYGLLAGAFLGMGVAGRENGTGTEEFLRTLPSPMWKVASVKLLLTTLVAVIPIILYIVIADSCYRFDVFYFNDTGLFGFVSKPEIPREVRLTEWFYNCSLVAGLSTISLLWWMAAIGANRSDEIRAGAIGFLAVVTIWFLLGYFLYLTEKHRLPLLQDALAYSASAAPGGPVFWQMFKPSYSPIPQLDKSLPVVSLFGHAAVAAWFLFRYGRSTTRTGRGDNRLHALVGAQAGKSPFRTQLGAIAWKQMRETGPLAVMALAGVLAIAAFVWWVDSQRRSAFGETFLGVNAAMSFLVVIVAGLGLYLEELKPNLSQFWRSRPTNFGLQFTVKYIAGLLVLVTVLGLPALAVGAYETSRFGGMNSKELLGAIRFIGWLFLMAYSLSMTSYCLLRQPLYAAIFTVLAIWLGSFAFMWAVEEPHWTLVVGAMLLSLTGTIAVGWLTVRNDWGWKW